MSQGFLSWKFKLTQEQERLWHILEFLLRVTVLALPLYMIIWLGVDLYLLQVAAASQSAWLLQALGYQVVLEGIGLNINNSFQFFLIPDCTGWKGMLFLFALIFAVKGISLRKRALGLAFGIPAIWLGNIGRVVGVVMVQEALGTEGAMLVHDWLFQAGLVALVLGIWLVWLLEVKGKIRFSRAFWHQR
jgi:exosortase/archaeosortase family protein